ncbi:kelch-like protein 30 [Colletotrichum tofieldiae]|uniref:Kelch-like protein 30 n=1 Tax=Colletotrichum tofieldiae TaxID=708197 RepID=A0A166TM10_9PEZI|nr:kelch-like protein 30 [Colletotrichum tofieldiae]GKT60306.1 kelch-like protein 30 [Colletotrichum tofieldiae]GKT68017.1 kelch-like protein 30 [Colletotrichum tofieldiae]GKT91000.1 kelch-like protein 30 [Colletotrichum tofieldiae]
MTTTLDRGAPRPEELGDAGCLLRQPQTIIWLKISGQSFAIHKSLLIESSKYFQRCLDGPFAESQTNTIDLSDDADDGEANVSISPLTLGTYVKLCYFTRLTAQRVKRSRRNAADHTEDSYEVSPFTLKPCDMHTPHDLTELVDMWSLCDRFHDDLLLGKVSTAIRETLDVGARKLGDAHCAEWWVFNFANGYVALESLHRRDDDVEGLLERLKELFVQNCSPGSWERLAYQLPSEFVVATSIAFQRKMATLVANEAAITRVNGASLCYECKTRVQMALKR